VAFLERRASNKGSFKLGSKNAAKMQQKCSANVMQLERAPNRVPSNLAAKMQQKCSKNAAKMQRKCHAARERA